MDDDAQKIIAGTVVLIALFIVIHPASGDISGVSDVIGTVGKNIIGAFYSLQGRDPPK